MQNYTLTRGDTSVALFCSWLNTCVGKLHPDCHDRVVVSIVSVHFVSRSVERGSRVVDQLDGYAIVETDTVVAIG